MENENELLNDQGVEDTAADTSVDVEALQAKLAEAEQTNRQLFERAKKAEGNVKVDGKWVKAPRAEEAIATQAKLEAKTGELDETAMLLLEVKGIKVDDQDEMNLVNEYREVGKSVKGLITNKIFQAELKALREEKAVQNAMPSSNKRSGAGPADMGSLITKFEATGQLPDDFDLRSQVVNAMEARSSASRPTWRK